MVHNEGERRESNRWRVLNGKYLFVDFPEGYRIHVLRGFHLAINLALHIAHQSASSRSSAYTPK